MIARMMVAPSDASHAEAAWSSGRQDVVACCTRVATCLRVVCATLRCSDTEGREQSIPWQPVHHPHPV